ncbi:alkylated DNA nucleotide flippase Atl1 [Agromyces cerinus]|uniref:GmrSD restriction endonuclease domain-containing protein n=1 Tax=Agromyces cerinus TaxID=33878 RepID=UPI0019567052|nr:DUF262 domain-containing protein [Agromyces cerinus]MBM7829361.1 alkylated DNA nucleotide flippase Atl1 [Agromyces cerinus]
MDVQETRLQQVLEGSKQYRVPLYQRPYSWTTKQLDRLWNDIVELAEHRVDAPHATHFTGSLVLSLGQVGPSGSEFLVVDGQQRLTTLTLLICALRDHYDEVEPDHPEKMARLEESYLVDRFKRGDARLKLLPTQADRDAYRSIISRNVDGAPQSGILEAYRFFRTRIHQADTPDDPHDIDRIESAVLNGLVFVSITAKGDDNVYRIFESLNNTGLKLTQGDLLRNYLFMRLGGRGEEIYDSWWLPMQRTLSPSDLETLFWIDLIWRNPLAKQGDIYTLQVERLRDLDDDQIVAEVRRFSDLAKLFSLIRKPEGESSAQVRKHLQRGSQWRLAAAEPLMLHLLRLRAEGRLDNDGLTSALHLIESFMVRRLVVGASTNGISRILYGAPGEVGEEDAVASLHGYLSRGRKFFATDAQIADAVVTKPFYYQGRSSQRKTLLSWLEQATPLQFGDRQLVGKEQVELENLTIEHVMPQTISAPWRESLEGDLGDFESADEVQEEYLHTLANLTLTGYNSELSNNPFAQKRELLTASGIRMNAEIATHERWGRAEILERGAVISKRISENWMAPLDDTDVSDAGVTWKVALDAIDAIPAGRWASYGDVAAVAGTHPVPLGHHLSSTVVPNAYRVLKRFGSVAPNFVWAAESPNAGIDPVELLRSEGIEFDAELRASQSQRMSVTELAEAIGLVIRSDVEPREDESETRNAFLEVVALELTPSTSSGVNALLDSWESLGGRIEYNADGNSCHLIAPASGARPKPIKPIILYASGSIEFPFATLEHRPPFDEPELREEYKSRLNASRVADLTEDISTLRYPSAPLASLEYAATRDSIADVLTWFLSEIDRYDAELAAAESVGAN